MVQCEQSVLIQSILISPKNYNGRLGIDQISLQVVSRFYSKKNRAHFRLSIPYESCTLLNFFVKNSQTLSAASFVKFHVPCSRSNQSYTTVLYLLPDRAFNLAVFIPTHVIDHQQAYLLYTSILCKVPIYKVEHAFAFAFLLRCPEFCKCFNIHLFSNHYS